MRGAARALWPLAKRGLPVYLVTLGLGAAGGGVYWGTTWATHSPRFAVAHIDMNGADKQDEAELDRAISPAMGGNLFLTDTKAVARELGELPWIDSAEVSRQLPNRLIVTVKEHQAAAIVALESLYLADDEGNPFKRAAIDRGEGEGLVVITGLSRDDFRHESAAARAAIRGALALEKAYLSKSERPTLSEIHIDPFRGYDLVLADSGARIHLGDCDESQISRRIHRFDSAWAALDDDERSRASSFFLDNETREQSVTIAFAK